MFIYFTLKASCINFIPFVSKINLCWLFFSTDKIIRHRACTLKDTAHAIIAAELDPEFNKLCEEIKEARIKRGKLNK